MLGGHADTWEERDDRGRRSRVLVICTDGAWVAGRGAGVGVYFGPGDARNVSERLTGDTQTAQRAGLTAVIRALEALLVPGGDGYGDEDDDDDDGRGGGGRGGGGWGDGGGDDGGRARDVIIRTDSNYTCMGVSGWIAGWKRNGWVTPSGEAVKNEDLWRSLDELLAQERSRRSVEIVWVRRGVADRSGNEAADRLATEALQREE